MTPKIIPPRTAHNAQEISVYFRHPGAVFGRAEEGMVREVEPGMRLGLGGVVGRGWMTGNV